MYSGALLKDALFLQSRFRVRLVEDASFIHDWLRFDTYLIDFLELQNEGSDINEIFGGLEALPFVFTHKW